MKYFSFHTHSTYCDGKLKPEEYVKRAIELDMESIGFSSHAPFLDSVEWAMKFDRLESYQAEIISLKEKYKGTIPVYLSLEIDYLPGISKPYDELKKGLGLDYTIGSVHLVKGESDEDFWFLDGPAAQYVEGLEAIFGGDARKAVKAYYHQVNEMILQQKPDVIGHIDKIKMNNQGVCFNEDEDWYCQLQEETLEVISKSNSIVEVNTRGWYTGKCDKLYPDGFFLEECARRNIPVTISTDAHHPDQLISEFDRAKEKLIELGFSEIKVFRNGAWENQPLKS
jgi:histidinol-phosphatase (PHP family)